jgi:hypothetical protein
MVENVRKAITARTKPNIPFICVYMCPEGVSVVALLYVFFVDYLLRLDGIAA